MKSIVGGFLCLLGSILLGVHLQSTLDGTFYFMEQQQLFLFDSDYVLNILKDIGGLATVISQFLIQFFRVPLVGPIVTIVLGGFTTWLFWLTLRKIHHAPYLFPLAFLPILFQYLYFIDSTYKYEGLIALLGWAFALYLYSHCTTRMEWIGRAMLGSVLAICLFISMGAVAMPFVSSILLFDALLKKDHWYAGTIPIILTILIGSFCVMGGGKPHYSSVLWINDYWHYTAKLTSFHNLSWQSVWIVMLLFFFFQRINLAKNNIKVLVAVVLVGLLGGYYTNTAKANKIQDLYAIHELIHYIDTEQWDAILRSKDLNMNDYLHLNVLNLALSHKGLLQTDLFKYPQSGIQSLMSTYQSHIEESWLFSQIYYHVGVTALAYDLAFGTTVGFTYGCPAMTKLLVKCNLIYGTYPAAERFISILERTWEYKDWAQEQRRFLYNDDAVENDPELGTRRKSLTDKEDLFANLLALPENLTLILEANPDNKVAFDYMIASLLLWKDMPSIKAFVEHYEGTEVLPTLPPLLQQAVISYAEHDPAYCLEHGVSEQLLAAFQDFKRKVVNLRRARQDLKVGLANYRQTFWYYLLFSK